MAEIESHPTRWNHTPETWEKRKFFTELFSEACDRESIAVKWLDEERWAGVIEKDGTSAPIYGYDLGLNSSSAAKVADSKADTTALLQYMDVPVLYHERLPLYMTDGRRMGAAALTSAAIEAVGLPLVAKPDALASGGKGVVLCDSREEVRRTLEALVDEDVVTAVSPYRDFREYRAVVLDGKARAVIEKSKQPSGWMHNHSKGAEHALVDPSDELHAQIGALGVRAAAAINLRFTTVDVAAINGPTPRLEVLEANDAVSVVYPSSPELLEAAMGIYGEAARLRLESA